MAEKKKSTRAMLGERVLAKNIPSTLATYNQVSGEFSATNGWEVILPTTGLYYETYYDLSGYTLDDLTLVPRYTQVQDGLPYFGAASTTNLRIFDIISQERLTPADFFGYTLLGNFPGSASSREDWRQVLMCNVKYMLPQTDFTEAGLLLTSTEGRFGSNEPTAVEKLWVYRIIITGGLPEDGDTITIPATRFIVGGEVIDEPDLEYMMRLKRSYELSQ